MGVNTIYIQSDIEGNTMYIQPNTNDYTGYSASVFHGSSTAIIEYFTSQGEVESPGIILGSTPGQKDDLVLPEKIDENIMDEDLVRFYRDKGYKLK